MQLIFLSTMERKAEENRTATAQVSITEHQGSWRVLWNEAGLDGRAEQDCWYEGINWKEMLHAYREGLRVKRMGGYFPVIDTTLQGSTESGKNRDVLMLQYYGEKHHSEELFEELRKWRRQQATKEGKSAFFVATNRMLYMVSTFLPQTIDELRSIPGFGQRKADAYGKELTELTSKQERLTSFPLGWVFAEVTGTEFEEWLLHQQRSREQQDQQREFQRKKVLEGVTAGFSLAELENSVGMKRSELVRLIEELDKNGYDMEPLVQAELAEIDEAQLAAARELFAKNGTRFLKPVLKELYTDEELKGLDLNALYEKLRLQRIRFRLDTAPDAMSGSDGQAAV